MKMIFSLNFLYFLTNALYLRQNFLKQKVHLTDVLVKEILFVLCNLYLDKDGWT